jgi:2,4-dichlorophenol 6-monooxygenase
MTAGTGVVAGAKPEWNRAQLLALFSDTTDGETRRAVLHEYFETNRITTAHLDVEMGYDYADAGFVVPDGSERPPVDPMGLDYRQTARPGHRMPHAWLRRAGAGVATHLLARPGAFMLLAGDRGEPWLAAAREVGHRLGVEIGAHAVGPGRELADIDGDWGRLRGHDEDGALLIRPDGFVAMRERRAVREPAATLEAALGIALGHPVAVPSGAQAPARG